MVTEQTRKTILLKLIYSMLTPRMNWNLEELSILFLSVWTTKMFLRIMLQETECEKEQG